MQKNIDNWGANRIFSVIIFVCFFFFGGGGNLANRPIFYDITIVKFINYGSCTSHFFLPGIPLSYTLR